MILSHRGSPRQALQFPLRMVLQSQALDTVPSGAPRTVLVEHLLDLQVRLSTTVMTRHLLNQDMDHSKEKRSGRLEVQHDVKVQGTLTGRHLIDLHHLSTMTRLLSLLLPSNTEKQAEMKAMILLAICLLSGTILHFKVIGQEVRIY